MTASFSTAWSASSRSRSSGDVSEPGICCLLQLGVGISAELYVGPATCHVGCDGHRAEPAGIRNDLGFSLMVMRVQDIVPDPFIQKQRRQPVRFLDARRSHEHRLSATVGLANCLEDCSVLLGFGPENEPRLVLADDFPIGRQRDDVEIVDSVQFLGIGSGGAGHAGKLWIEPKVVLHGRAGERDGFLLNRARFPSLRWPDAARPKDGAVGIIRPVDAWIKITPWSRTM